MNHQHKYRLSAAERTPTVFQDMMRMTQLFLLNVDVRYCTPEKSAEYMARYFPQTYSGFLLRDGSK